MWSLWGLFFLAQLLFGKLKYTSREELFKWALTPVFSLALSIDVQTCPSEPLYYVQMAVLLLQMV